MQFDDRLATVLDQSVDDPRARAVQWRQLVDLIARGAPAPGSPLMMRAMQRIAEGRDTLPEELRAAAARAVAGLQPAGRTGRDLRRRQPGRCGAGDCRGAARCRRMGHGARRRQR